METIDKFYYAIGAFVGSLGGGALVFLALSRKLTDLWAERYIEKLKTENTKTLKTYEVELSRITQDRTRKLEALKRHYERQIEEFYGPLFSMVNLISPTSSIHSDITNIIKSNENALNTVEEYFHETYFNPYHNEIRQILKTKLYLIEGSMVPESFITYLQHATQERDQRILWKIHKIDTLRLEGIPFPKEFEKDISRGFAAAMKNHEECLNGLKDDLIASTQNPIRHVDKSLSP